MMMFFMMIVMVLSGLTLTVNSGKLCDKAMAILEVVVGQWSLHCIESKSFSKPNFRPTPLFNTGKREILETNEHALFSV